MKTVFTEFFLESVALGWPKIFRGPQLSKLTSGEVRVGDAARFVGAAV